MKPERRDVLAPGVLALTCLAIMGATPALADTAYPWLGAAPVDTVQSRVAPPPGWRRIAAAPGSFAAWLRGLPVKPGRPQVHLFNGKLKGNQEAHFVVLDVDTGRRDLQQCADAVMRLRAEFQRQAGHEGDICFRFTDGTEARWGAWKDGQRPKLTGREMAFEQRVSTDGSWSAWRNAQRPKLTGRKMAWEQRARADASYASFRRYLDIVFGYAGTASLVRELDRVTEPRRIEAGDVFIQGGSPGHAVIVVDVAEDAAGRRAVLLAQSYMPAQEIHILRNPATPDNPWYIIEGDGPLATPEWDFPGKSLRRFSAAGCPTKR